MTDYVTVKITGTFPAEDIDVLAAFYGVGNSMMGQPVQLTQEQKLEALVALAETRLADFLATPAKQAAQIQSATVLRETTAAIDERVKSALSSEIITTEA